jgi:heme A synthase
VHWPIAFTSLRQFLSEDRRLLHPALSVTAAALAIFLAFRLESWQPGSLAARWANRWTLRFVFLQIVAGVANVLLLAPVWMQLVHLLLADLVWISYIVVAAQALAGQPEPSPMPSPQAGEREPRMTLP